MHAHTQVFCVCEFKYMGNKRCKTNLKKPLYQMMIHPNQEETPISYRGSNRLYWTHLYQHKRDVSHNIFYYALMKALDSRAYVVIQENVFTVGTTNLWLAKSKSDRRSRVKWTMRIYDTYLCLRNVAPVPGPASSGQPSACNPNHSQRWGWSRGGEGTPLCMWATHGRQSPYGMSLHSPLWPGPHQTLHSTL